MNFDEKIHKYGIRLVLLIVSFLVLQNLFSQQPITSNDVPINIVLEEFSDYEDTTCWPDIIDQGRLGIRDIETTLSLRENLNQEFVVYDGIIRIIQNVIPEFTEYRFYIIFYDSKETKEVTDQYAWMMAWCPDKQKNRLIAIGNPKSK